MSLTTAISGKANVKQKSAADLSPVLAQPVVNKYEAVSTASQTVINLPFIVDINTVENFELFVDGKLMTRGATSDFTFTAVDANNSSSQITMTFSLIADLNITAIKRGLKKDRELGTDSRFTQIYAAAGAGLQDFVDESTTIAVPYTGIVNRKRITDIANDLKPRQGVDRLIVQSVFEVQDEYGASGEKVSAAINDSKGLIRFVGTWVNNVTNSGTYISSIVVGDYIEVTFYGTGLNIIASLSASSLNMLPSVDGGADGANIFASAYSAVLNARGYASNQVLNVYSGLNSNVAAIHTVKLKNNSVNEVKIFGFEILNESTSVKTNPGTSYQRLQKAVTAAQSSVAYNTGFETITQDGVVVSSLGSRGARVLVYQKSDGTIAKAAYAVSTAQANLSSANHQYEEISRVYHFREFGAARADDFNTLTTTSTRAFTLGDGSTTLVGASVAADLSDAGLYPNAVNSYITITFIGTGLDVQRSRDIAGAVDANTISVDGGSSIGSFSSIGTSAGTSKVEKIVSGLPYGTHTVKFHRSSTATGTYSISAFKVYGPKKPILPAGAIELGTYNVVATYAQVSSFSGFTDRDKISTGVIRKTGSSEFAYTGSWAFNAVDPDHFVSGFDLRTSTNGNYVEYTFTGTGVDIQTFVNAAAQSIIYSIDGATNLSGFATNLVQGSTGVTFTAATGTLAGTSAAGATISLSITGLTYGKHVLKILRNTATDFMYSDTIGVVTPVHSPVFLIPADIQNTLPVGSCSVADGRVTSPIKSVSVQKARLQLLGLSGTMTTSATAPVPILDMQGPINCAGGDLSISYHVTVVNNAGTASTLSVQIYVDGVAYGRPMEHSDNRVNYYANIADSVVVPVSPGTHFIQLMAYVSSAVSWGIGGLGTNSRSLTVREL